MIKVLIVDDEREEREGIAYLLEKYGYPVEAVQASNGAEASKYIRSHEIDILFTDVKMPVMNGLDLAKEVNELRPHVKIIIFSAYGEFEYAKQALEANAVSYLLKPIEIDEFRRLMDDVIDSVNKTKELYEKRQQDDRQNRKKNRPSRYSESRKNSAMEGSVQVKKAALMIMPWPSQNMSSTLTHSSVPAPAKLRITVVRQERRGSKKIRNISTTWSIDHKKEISRRTVTARHLPGCSANSRSTAASPGRPAPGPGGPGPRRPCGESPSPRR